MSETPNDPITMATPYAIPGEEPEGWAPNEEAVISETPIGDAVQAEYGSGEVFVNDVTPEDATTEPEDPQDVGEPVDDPADDDEAGETGNPDDLPDPGPGEAEEGELTEDTGALIDEDEDPGTPLPDEPHNPQP